MQRTGFEISASLANCLFTYRQETFLETIMSENQANTDLEDELEVSVKTEYDLDHLGFSQDGNETNCCLCPEGSRLQNLLLDHLQIAHSSKFLSSILCNEI